MKQIKKKKKDEKTEIQHQWKSKVETQKTNKQTNKQINEEEITTLPEREFRIMIIKTLWKLENRMEKMQEAFNTFNTIIKDIEEIKNKQTEMNNNYWN